jgi:hypothetical protein
MQLNLMMYRLNKNCLRKSYLINEFYSFLLSGDKAVENELKTEKIIF